MDVVKEAKDMADSVGVRIFTANIIYHLFDQFTAYMADLKAKEKEKAEVTDTFHTHTHSLTHSHHRTLHCIALRCIACKRQLPVLQTTAIRLR